MTKDSDEQLHEETHRVRPGEPKHRNFCSHSVGVRHLPNTQLCSPTQKLSEPHTLEVFMEASRGMYGLLIHFPVPLLSRGWDRGGR